MGFVQQTNLFPFGFIELNIFFIFVSTNIVMTNKEEQKNRGLVVAVLRAGNQFNEELNQFVKSFGISLPQFNVLRILRGQKGEPANLSTINERMIHKMSNTTRLVDKLIEKTLVQRRTCAQNRRKIEIFITDSGQNLLKEMDHQLDQKEKQLTEQLNEKEKEKLIALLSSLIQS